MLGYQKRMDPKFAKLWELFQADLKEFRVYAKKFLRIKDEYGKIVPFVLNLLQEKVLLVMLDLESKALPIWIIVLKCRQTGISTLIEAFLFWRTHQELNQKCLIIGHDTDSSQNLFAMYQRYYENLPEAIQPAIDRNQRDKKLSYKETKNEVTIQTAGSNIGGEKAGTGRSATYQYIHATECLGGNSKIILWDGRSVPIKDISIGDNVTTSEGSLGTVIDKFSNGIKQTYKLSVWYSNEPIEVTDNHKILTQYGWKEVRDLTINDYVALPKIIFTNAIKTYTTYYENAPKTKKRPGGSKAKESLTIPLNYDWGYVIGYYLAEGHIKKDLSLVSFAYHKDETYINRVIKTIGGNPKTIQRVGPKTKITTFYDRTLAKLIWELAGRTSTKEIPDFIFDTNYRFAEGIIHGFYAGDGSKTKNLVDHNKYEINRATFVNTNEKVMRQIRRMLISLDYGVASLRSTETSRYGKKGLTRYDLDLYGDGAAKLLKAVGGYVAKKSRVNKFKTINVDGQYFVKIKSIETSIEQEVFDITIDQNEHNFETTIGIVHNCAFYPDYKTTFAALLQASKKAKMIILETTANGFNEFRNDWENAKSGDSDYVPVFLCWLEFYSKPFRDEDEKNRLLRDLGSNPDYNLYPNEEKILVEDYGATLENLNWRRWAIVNLCKKDINTFHQEYPRDDQEAFVSTGMPVFTTHVTAAKYAKYHKLETDRKIPIAQGNLEVEYDLVNEDYERLVSIGMTSYMDLRKFIKDVKFVPDKNGFIKIYGDCRKSDTERFKFVGAADVAEGLEQGDFSVVEVLNRETKEICLEWHGHCFTPDTLIYSKRGMIPIKEIITGDEVWTHKNRFRKVKNIYKRLYVGDIVELRSQGNYETIKVTPEHPIYAGELGFDIFKKPIEKKGVSSNYSYSKRDKLLNAKWEYAENTKAVAYSKERKIKKHKYKIKQYRSKKSPILRFQSSENLASVLGYYLAEGNLGRNNNKVIDSVKFNFAYKEKDTLVKDCANKLTCLGLEPKITEVKDKGVCLVRVYDTFFAKLLYQLGGEHSWEKKISADVLEWENGLLEILIESYWQGDGCLIHRDNSTVRSATTVSPILARQIRDILIFIGKRPRIEKLNPKPSKRVKTARPRYNILWVVNDKTKYRYMETESHIAYKISKKKKVAYDGIVYNLEVEEDNSYSTACYVVHNCDVDIFANEIHKLQLFFKNDIHFGIEKNNQGLAVIVKAEQLGVNLYYAEEFRSGVATDTEKLGFSTDQNTRRYALNNLIEWVRDDLFICKNPAFWSETMTFVRNAKGKMQAQNKDRDPGTKCFDDRVMSMAILTVVHQWLPNYSKDDPLKLPYYVERKIKKQKGKLSSMSE